MQCVHIEAAGLIAQRQHRVIVPDELRELVGYRRKQLVSIQLRHKRIGDIEQRAQPVPLPDCLLLCEEGLDRDGKLAGNALQERDFGRTGIEWRYGAEAECAKPVIARSEGNEHQGTDPEVASASYELRPASFRLERGDYEWLLVQPYPTGRILVDRQPKARDDGIAGLIQNVPLHGVAVGIVQNQPDMIKADDSAKRFGYAREQTSQVSAAGDRTRERHHSLIKCLFAGAVRAADQEGGIHRCDGPASVITRQAGLRSRRRYRLKWSSLQFSDSRSTFSMTYPPFAATR